MNTTLFCIQITIRVGSKIFWKGICFLLFYNTWIQNVHIQWKQDVTEKLSTLVSRLSVLTIILIKLKQSSSLFCWFRHNAGVPISDTVVFSKVLIFSNSPIVEKVSELNQISSELISTSSELILTIAELILTIAEQIWRTGLIITQATENKRNILMCNLI